MESWWGDLDAAVLRCLAARDAAVAPGELGSQLGISPAATQSLLALLAQEGKIRICAVESVPGNADGTANHPRP
jgi:hypothetical protein